MVPWADCYQIGEDVYGVYVGFNSQKSDFLVSISGGGLNRNAVHFSAALFLLCVCYVWCLCEAEAGN